MAEVVVMLWEVFSFKMAAHNNNNIIIQYGNISRNDDTQKEILIRRQFSCQTLYSCSLNTLLSSIQR